MNSSIFLGIWLVIKKKPRGNFFALNSQGEGFVFIKTLKTVLLCLMLHCSARWQYFN